MKVCQLFGLTSLLGVVNVLTARGGPYSGQQSRRFPNRQPKYLKKYNRFLQNGYEEPVVAPRSMPTRGKDAKISPHDQFLQDDFLIKALQKYKDQLNPTNLAKLEELVQSLRSPPSSTSEKSNFFSPSSQTQNPWPPVKSNPQPMTPLNAQMVTQNNSSGNSLRSSKSPQLSKYKFLDTPLYKEFFSFFPVSLSEIEHQTNLPIYGQAYFAPRMHHSVAILLEESAKALPGHIAAIFIDREAFRLRYMIGEREVNKWQCFNMEEEFAKAMEEINRIGRQYPSLSSVENFRQVAQLEINGSQTILESVSGKKVYNNSDIFNPNFSSGRGPVIKAILMYRGKANELRDAVLNKRQQILSQPNIPLINVASEKSAIEKLVSEFQRDVSNLT